MQALRRTLNDPDTAAPAEAGAKFRPVLLRFAPQVSPDDASGQPERSVPDPVDIAADAMVLVGEAPVLKETADLPADDVATESSSTDDAPAPYAWAGRLICMLTAATTGSALIMTVI